MRVRVHFATHNVTSLRPPREPTLLEHSTGQLMREVLLPADLAFCGIQEHHWLGYSEFKVKGYSFLYFGHRDLAREGVALALSLNVAGSLWLQPAVNYEAPTYSGPRLLSLCLSHRLSAAASYFAQPARRQATFTHWNAAAHNTTIDFIFVLPACQQATFTHQNVAARNTTIDYILVLQHHRNIIRSTRVYPSYSFHNTSQRLLGGYLRLRLYVAARARLKAECFYNIKLLRDPNNMKLSAW
ncbi:unnamed protein product [Sphagnum troendelagicum]